MASPSRRSSTGRSSAGRSRTSRSGRTRRLVSERGSSSGEKIRYAVVGLGYISQIAVLPAFANARRNSTLAAIVSGDSKKLKELARRYRVPTACSYEDLDSLLGSGEIDAVYIATPNHLHASQTIQAARHGVHVLCEKPIAMTDQE